MTYNVDYFKNKRKAEHISYNMEQTYVPIPGTMVRVLFEFPDYNGTGKSAIIQMDDVMTITMSSQRVKAPVTLLGTTSIDGYGLGTRMVAGSVIRSVFTVDNLTAMQSKIYLEEQDKIKARLTASGKNIPSGLPLKDKEAILQDDLTAFNIHIYAITEDLTLNNEPRERFETIIGATIINSGTIYSIEDLITENTFTFQAKAYRSSVNIEDYSRGYGNGTTFKSGSKVLQEFKKG